MMEHDYECPYCGLEMIYTSDPIGDGDTINDECEKCGKKFIVTCSYSVSYDTHQADCLNGGPHNFRPIIGVPKEYFENRVSCKDCGKETLIEKPKEVTQCDTCTFTDNCKSKDYVGTSYCSYDRKGEK